MPLEKLQIFRICQQQTHWESISTSGIRTSPIAFLTIFRFFCYYGLQQLLFLNCLGDDLVYVQRGYTRLDQAFHHLAWIFLPSFFAKLACKIIFFSSVKVSLPNYIILVGVPLYSVVFILVLGSWVYQTGFYFYWFVFCSCSLFSYKFSNLKFMLCLYILLGLFSKSFFFFFFLFLNFFIF